MSGGMFTWLHKLCAVWLIALVTCMTARMSREPYEDSSGQHSTCL